MMSDDRPIKPSQEYLQSLNQPKERLVSAQNNYLRRSSGKHLPCFSEAKLKQSHLQSESPKNEPTKRQIYERIKSQNQAMYGKQKKKKEQTSAQRLAVQTELLKKQKAKRIELYLMSKEKVIQTDEEKVITPSLKRVEPKAFSSTNARNEEKEKYERLIKQMEKEREALKKEREMFQEEKLLLEFRREIKNEEGVRGKRNPVENRNQEYYRSATKAVSQKNIRREPTNSDSNSILNESIRGGVDKRKSLSRKRDFKSDLVESKKLIENISQKIIEIESNQKIIHQKNQLAPSKPKLQLQNLPLINSFSVNIFTNDNQHILMHPNNKYYRQFLNRQRTLKVISQSKDGNKQITRYQDGSFTKNMKKYRLIEFPNGYKLTIFQNNDVKQEMPGGMVCYYSRTRDVNKITFCSNFDIYYFYKEKQVEVHYKPSGRKEIRYRNGVKRTVIDPDV